MKPTPLKLGDTIAVFSPSAPATATAPLRFKRAQAFIESKGFRFKAGTLTGKSDHYRSGTIIERANELNDLIRDPEVRCIMSAIGGMNSNALLPYIDYEALKNDPKIIIGYSDVTALLLGIYAKIGLETYYGPAVVASLGELPPFVDMTWDYFEQILIQPQAYPHVLPTPAIWTEEFIDWQTQTRSKAETINQLTTLSDGQATGRLIGGNLNTMMGIWGTPYMPSIEMGDILLIEDSLKDIATLERSFSLLKLSGVFDRIGGLILGKHELFKDLGTKRKPTDVLLEVIGEPSFPILADFDCCHTHPMLTLPIGSQVTLDATRQTLTLIGV